MRKLISIVLFCLMCVVLYAQEKQSAITETKIVISVPKYDKNNELQYDVYEKVVPVTLDEAKKDIGTIINAYNTTINSYNNHVKDLETELTFLKKELANTKSLYDKKEEITDAVINIDKEKKKNDDTTITFVPSFGLSAFYGTIFGESSNMALLTGDVYLSKLKFSFGPILNVLKEDDKNTKYNFGLIFGIGYKF